MPAISLPDGTIKEFDKPVTPYDVAASIGAGLAKAAMAAIVDEVEWDLMRPITSDAELRCRRIDDR